MNSKELHEWYLDAYSEVIGKKIIDVRPLTEEEVESTFWGGGHGGHAFILEDGTMIIPSEDEEGNGPGSSFVYPRGEIGEEDE